MWIFTGILSLILTGVTILCALNNRRGKYCSAFMAVSFVALTILMQYHQIYEWVLGEEWSSLMDVVPSMHSILFWYVLIIILLNGIFAFRKHHK